MTETAKAKTSLIDEFKGLNIKQVVAIVGAMIIAVLMQTYGILMQCFGMLIIAAILYMVPHITGVTSVKIKTVIGVVFIVITMLTSVFVAGPAIVDSAKDPSEIDNEKFGNIRYVENADGTFTATMDFYITNISNVEVRYGTVTQIMYGGFEIDNDKPEKLDLHSIEGDDKSKYWVTWSGPLEEGTLEGNILKWDETSKDDDGKDKTTTYRAAFIYNNDATMSEIHHVAFSGLWFYVAATGSVFFIILIFSALMRRSAEKTRVKMEADGRLYPKGYGRCKECGGMVLPGEVNCRKCGAYIDVPEELRAQKKDYFICENCGAEVPNDADICPKCGAKFDSVENEVVHADGTVDVSEDTFECSECGAVVPANATRCPKCGAKFDEDEEKKD